MLIIGYFLAVLIGLVLGIIGGGGTMLTLPLLVFIFKVDVLSATSYTMFIVGITSAVGSYAYFKSGMVNLKKAVSFGVPSMIVVAGMRHWVVPSIPAVLIDSEFWVLSKEDFMMLFFALLMLLASVSMIRKSKSLDDGEYEVSHLMLVLNGTLVGVVSGLVGAGGGFLIIPALVIFSRTPIKQAIGTSLIIITANSAVGFVGDLGAQNLDWNLLLSVTFATVVGIFVGTKVSSRIDGAKMKPAFGWFILLMGIAIILNVFF
jgi:uncharacterized membrane protein YfcA